MLTINRCVAEDESEIAQVIERRTERPEILTEFESSC